MINTNNNTDIALHSGLIRQDSLSSILGSNSQKRNNTTTIDSNLLIDSTDISNKAMEMYQKELDIRNFAQLVLSDTEDTSHNELVEKLFSEGVIDVFEDNVIASLSDNTTLRDDLEL